MPTEAEEDWMMAVKIMPARIPRTGLEKVDMIRMKPSDSRRGSMAELIMSMPMNNTPQPRQDLPDVLEPGAP